MDYAVQAKSMDSFVFDRASRADALTMGDDRWTMSIVDRHGNVAAVLREGEVYGTGSSKATAAELAALPGVVSGREFSRTADAAQRAGKAGLAATRDAALATSKRSFKELRTQVRSASVDTPLADVGGPDADISLTDSVYARTKATAKSTYRTGRNVYKKPAQVRGKANGRLARIERRARAREAKAARALKKGQVDKAAKFAARARRVRNGKRANVLRRIASSSGPKMLAALALGGGGVAAVFLTVALVAAAASAVMNQDTDYDLSDAEAYTLAYLREKGFSDVCIAAIMGNIDNEGGWGPWQTDSSIDKRGHYIKQYGMMQFTHDKEGSWSCNGCQFDLFFNWIDTKGYNVTNTGQMLKAQLDFKFDKDSGGDLWSRGWSSGNSYGSDPGRRDTTPAAFQAESDLTVATFSWMACYERPANGSEHFDARLVSAQKYYQVITSQGSGSDGEYVDLTAASNEQQRRILQGAADAKWPGKYYCAKWVSRVYERAGYGYPGGHGNTILNGARTSSNRKDLKVGMAISAQYGDSSAGAKYGHVCIYIGNGKVKDSISSGLRVMDLDSWLSHYGAKGWVKWGYPASVAKNMGL